MTKKIDKRINYQMVLDTETCPLDKDYNGVCPQNMFVYDFSWVVTDKRGNIYETRSFLNTDIFLDEKELMQSAYYSKKIPEYWKQVEKGETVLTSFRNIRKVFMEDVANYGINQFFAFNMRFDIGSINNTERWLSKSKWRSFFPKDAEIHDIMKMAKDVVYKTPTYQKFCFDNGYVTKHKTPRAQMKAETYYKYITQNVDFEEEHKGKDDCLIETVIKTYCVNKHKRMDSLLWIVGA